MTKLYLLFNLKDEIYSLILVTLEQVIKMLYYKLVKVTINAFALAKVVFNIII